ncbi:MAG TPA: reverse transcriptase/maturase family protein [Candidatus Paceibacterota bacterium]
MPEDISVFYVDKYWQEWLGGVFFMVMIKKFKNKYDDIISVENLLTAWKEFLNGKRKRKDVRVFDTKLADNIFDLHAKLKNKTYTHGEYKAFTITDPKKRNIHKAMVKDRLLHHAIHRKLYPFFDSVFISDSFSCRNGKGIHAALDRFRYFFRKVGRNNTRTVWVLKCDIRKFFASIDHNTLISILKSRIEDENITSLLEEIISSFEYGFPGKGLPLGNLTSQLFANIYMNEFDQYIKHKLRIKYYIRYADDFVILSENKVCLESVIPRIHDFLNRRLLVSIHPNKVFIKTLSSGVDFLGWVHFPTHRVLRTVTKLRMFKNLKNSQRQEVLQSYLGLLSHGDGHELENRIRQGI